ncbi:MAG: TfoX/Sxy family protein [Nocardioides sp.]
MAYDEQLAERIRALLLGEPALTERRMFGGLAFLVAGNMAVAAGGQGRLMVRFDPERTAELLAEPHTDPFVMPGRRMKGWLQIEPLGFASDDDLERWVGIGLSRARALPPK